MWSCVNTVRNKFRTKVLRRQAEDFLSFLLRQTEYTSLKKSCAQPLQYAYNMLKGAISAMAKLGFKAQPRGPNPGARLSLYAMRWQMRGDFE